MMESYLIKNEKGSFTMIALVICMLSLSLFTIIILKKIQIHNELKKILHQYNCIKNYNGITENYLYYMEKTNNFIINTNNIEKILIFFPYLKLANLSAKALKTVIQKGQEINTLSYLKNVSTLQKQKCHIPINAYIAPYRLFPRNKDGSANLRNKVWSITFIKEKIIVTFGINAKNIKINTKKFL